MHQLLRKLTVSFIIGILGALVFGYLAYARFNFTEKFEAGTFDIRMAARLRLHPDRSPTLPDPPVVMADIDEYSLLGKEFPLPRDEYAAALRTLKEAGAVCVGFDVMFPEHAPARVDNDSWDSLDKTVSDILSSELMGIEDKTWALRGEILDVRFRDIDKRVADAAREHGGVFFPVAFGERASLSRRADYIKLQKETAQLAKDLHRMFAEDRSAAEKWFQRRTLADRTDVIRELLRKKRDSRRFVVTPSLERALDQRLKTGLADILELDKGISSIADVAGLLVELRYDDAEFDRKLMEQFNATEVELHEAYSELMDRYILRDVLSRYDSGDARLYDIVNSYLEDPLMDLFTADWVPGVSFTREFPEVDAILRDHLLLKKGRQADDLAELLPFSYRVEAPLIPYIEACPSVSYIQIEPDLDGIVRHWPLFRAYEGSSPGFEGNPRIYPIMSLALTLKYLGVPFDKVEIELGKEARIPLPDGRTLQIPIDERGYMIINWVSGDFSHTFRHVSFRDLVEAEAGISAEDEPLVPEEEDEVALERARRVSQARKLLNEVIRPAVNGKIVLIGLTATGTHDFNPIPLNPRYPMVGAHANCIANILSGTVIRRAKPHTDFLVTSLVLFAFCMLLPLLPYMLSFLLAVGVAVGYGAVAYYAQLNGVWLNGFYVMSGIVLLSVALFAAKYVLEGRSRAMLKRIFSAYLSPKLVDQMAEKLPTLKLGGDKMTATVYFSDVAGFTSLSESMPPERLVELLNIYLTRMTDNILEADGLLDKYIGDAVVAAFGVPFPDEKHAERACRVAILNNRALVELNEVFTKEGLPELKQRIGLNSGELVAGNMGSVRRLAYTVMGDTVNLGARLENANKYYGTSIMITEMTRRELGPEFCCRTLDRIQVVGKKEPVTVYELVELSDAVSQDRVAGYTSFEEGLEHFFARRWDDAQAAFSKADEVLGADGPSRTFLERIRKFRENPPPEDWNGVWEMTAK